jgi:hypothetical protein
MINDTIERSKWNILKHNGTGKYIILSRFPPHSSSRFTKEEIIKEQMLLNLNKYNPEVN